MGLALSPTASPGEEATPTFAFSVEGGVPAARSAPRSIAMVTGWKHPCIVEIENRDAAPCRVALRVEGRAALIASASEHEVQANEKRAIPILLQTLSPDAHRFRLVVACGQREAGAAIMAAARLDRAGVAFGMVEHFEYQGSIDAAGTPPNKPPKDDPKGKDVSHLTTAPSQEAGERVLADMRVLQEAGCQFFRVDLAWRIVEYEEGRFHWDRADWLVRSLRSSDGGGCRLVAQIGYQPLWLPTDFPRTEAGMKAWSRWVGAVVSRYAKEVDVWEMRNGCILAHQGYGGIAYFELFDWGGSSTYLVRHAAGHRTRGFEAYRLLVAALAGSVPSEPPQVPRSRVRDAAYDGLVVKAFRRGDEDILCVWNNDAQRHVLELEPRANPEGDDERCFWEHVRFASKGEFVTEEGRVTDDRAAEGVEVAVEPFEFHVLSRFGPRAGFGWLVGTTVR